jgi:hypothetical protein
VGDLSSGGDIFIGQQIITGNAGQVQIVFHDNTHLVIGPASTLVISEYLLRGEQTVSKFVIDALGGSFRFVTGDSQKDAYEINTPTGTMGVRGTAFDFTVAPFGGVTHVLLYHGAVNLCAIAGECVLLEKACELGVLPDKSQAKLVGARAKDRDATLEEFVYLISQQPLRQDFRVVAPGRCKPIAIAKAAKTVEEEEPPAAPPPPPPPEEEEPPHNNNGGGNGGEGPDEPDGETGNPGKHLGWYK